MPNFVTPAREAQTLKEQHELALLLLPQTPFSLFEAATRTLQISFPHGRPYADDGSLYFLCFFVQGGGEVLLATYPCDEEGRVADFRERYEVWALNADVATAKFRFAFINDILELWTL